MLFITAAIGDTPVVTRSCVLRSSLRSETFTKFSQRPRTSSSTLVTYEPFRSGPAPHNDLRPFNPAPRLDSYYITRVMLLCQRVFRARCRQAVNEYILCTNRVLCCVLGVGDRCVRFLNFMSV